MLSGNKCICLIVEIKSHLNEYFEDMQLVGYMIASLQENYNYLGQVFPRRMIGIMVRGFKFIFYSLELSESYMDELKYSLPNDNKGILREYGIFDIRNNQDRASIFMSLYAIKMYSSL